MDFVTLTRQSDDVEVKIDTNGVAAGIYSVTLESFDTNSSVQSTLRRDVLRIEITELPSVSPESLYKELTLRDEASWKLKIIEGSS